MKPDFQNVWAKRVRVDRGAEETVGQERQGVRGASGLRRDRGSASRDLKSLLG